MNENKAIYIFLAIAIVMFLTIGGTLAYFTWVTNSSQQTAISFQTTAGLSCSADGGGNITSSDVKLAPATCTDSEHAIQRTITTSVTNSNEGIAYMSLSLKVNQMASELAASENFKYALTSNSSSCTTDVIKTGTFTGATTNSTFTILEDQEYQTSGSGTYYLYIWLDEAESNNNTQNKTFNLSLTGVCTNHISTIGDTLSASAVIDNIASEFVTNSTGVNFDAISSDTNGKGLYIRAGTENDAHPIYYYRGAVDNNNVLFGGFCWKIVRTTSTGGTKLIYNGLPSGTNNNECTNTTGTDTQLATTSVFNSNSNLPADVGYMYGTRYPYSSATGTGWYYAPDVTYSNGTYTLVSKGSYNVETKSTINGTNLNYQHYTCGSDTETTCASVRYVYNVSSSTAYYITLSNSKKVEDALNEMLTSSANTTDSTIKTAIDTWYAANMTSYTKKLEDTPYCNDRTIYQLGGWNPNGGSSTTGYLYFNAYGRIQSPYTPSLTCNTNDAFTVSASNGNGKLTYPVGLLTADEIRLAGGKDSSGNSTYYLYTNQNWWSGSPRFFYFSAYEFIVYPAGTLYSNNVGGARGVRPAVSLKPGTKFVAGGTGISTNPYVVE